MIWDTEAQFLFYATTAFGLTQIVTFIWYYRRRNPWMFLSILGILVCIVSDYFAWEAYGSCVLPYSRMVKFRPGVITLCPGQGVDTGLRIWVLPQLQQDI